MEIGHNVGHGQWDWMNDPEIHSSTWEWDMVAVSSQWRYSHNYRHHVYTNIIGHDHDLGFGVMRVTRDEPWQPAHLFQPLRNALLAAVFEWGIAFQGVHSERDRPVSDGVRRSMLGRKVARQALKDYVVFPALTVKRWRRTLLAAGVANLLRNLWAYVVIFCGHFPDGAEKFTADVLGEETRGSGTCGRSSAPRTSAPAACWRSPVATSATRSSTTASPICRAIGTPRSRCGSASCARSTTCPTPPRRCRISTC